MPKPPAEKASKAATGCRTPTTNTSWQLRVVAGAGAIITLNLKDFPADRLPHGIETLSPAQFAFNTVSLDPHRALQAIGKIAGRSGHHGPTRTVDELLDLLAARYHFHHAVEALRSSY